MSQDMKALQAQVVASNQMLQEVMGNALSVRSNVVYLQSSLNEANEKIKALEASLKEANDKLSAIDNKVCEQPADNA